MESSEYMRALRVLVVGTQSAVVHPSIDSLEVAGKRLIAERWGSDLLPFS